ncbi:hypothetical protein [Effusibacillus lacus]|uniref:Uncharacterized protein n=1 Tax=Effusibacillus lacus TaxID=1348429 RepID=A0A292YD98_9BACL|nr:hypothetical protein [Effusibacillus lacus]TCS71402.1 hypothetical protein EDD64_12620 [Effusibacillus lacus]GAX89932.1 hypothetical protein EFBL_1558 [Effusibacillus lacus]
MNLFGWMDLYTGLEKTKEIGGCIEAASIELANGEKFRNAVIMRVEYTGNRFYSLGFMDEQGTVRVAHVDQVSVLVNPEHKTIGNVQNLVYQQWAREQKRTRALRLLEISQGAARSSYEKELRCLLEDIGVNSVQELYATLQEKPILSVVGA